MKQNSVNMLAELAASNKQSSIALKIVNEISGRKNSNSAKLKASNNGR